MKDLVKGREKRIIEKRREYEREEKEGKPERISEEESDAAGKKYMNTKMDESHINRRKKKG